MSELPVHQTGENHRLQPVGRGVGAPRFRGGRIRSLSNFLISGQKKDFHPPYFVPGVQKSTLLLQNRGHAEVLKKTPSSAKYVMRLRPPLNLSEYVVKCYFVF